MAASMMMPLVLPTYRPEIMFPDLTVAVDKALKELIETSSKHSARP